MFLKKPIKTFTLRLSDIRDLFVAPQVNPFAQDEVSFIGESGLERLVRQLDDISIKQRAFTLTLLLPPEKITPSLSSQVHKIIERYCNLKIEENLRHIRILRKQGFQALLRGLIFLAICFTLAVLVKSFLPQLIGEILSEGFTIIGWVVLWHPVEALLYDPSPLRKQIALYQLVRQVKIRFKPI